MKSPKELSRAALVDIVTAIQARLYLDVDCLEFIAGQLAAHGLVPARPCKMV